MTDDIERRTVSALADAWDDDGRGRMREEAGDLFTYPADAIVIPTNTTVRRDGRAVMGAGVAKQAAERWPWLALSLGNRLRRDSPRRAAMTYFEVGETLSVVCLPTKRDWRDPADLDLIRIEAGRLVACADLCRWRTVALPRLGCGLGGLDWETDVRLILSPILDGRFVVLTPSPADQGRQP